MEWSSKREARDRKNQNMEVDTYIKQGSFTLEVYSGFQGQYLELQKWSVVFCPCHFGSQVNAVGSQCGK